MRQNVRLVGLVALLVLLLCLTVGSASAASVRITTQPADVTAAVGDTAVFKVGVRNQKAITWHLVSPDESVDLFVRDIATIFPSSSISGKNTKNLSIINVQPEMNGWKVYCHFTGNANLKTEMATLWIEGMDHTEITTPEPTATPVPTPTPVITPVPTAAPTPVVTATPTVTETPVPVEEPEATQAPKATATPTAKPTATPAPVEEDDGLMVRAIGCTITYGKTKDLTELDFNDRGSVSVKINSKTTPAYWVINGTRYDFTNAIPKTITISDLRYPLTIEAVRKGKPSETLISAEEIQNARTGENLAVTGRHVNFCFVNKRGVNGGGWFNNFDFTEDFKNKATKKTENGGRITLRVRSSAAYGETLSYWKINGAHFSFNTHVVQFKVTDLRETTKYEAVMTESKRYTVSCSGCTFSDEKHSSAMYATDVPYGTTIRVTPVGGDMGFWSGSRETEKPVKAKSFTFTVRRNCSFIWHIAKSLPKYFKVP